MQTEPGRRPKLPPAARRALARLCRLDNRHAPLALLLDHALIALAVAACTLVTWWLYPLAVLVIVTRQKGLANLLHEAAHGTLAKNRVLNRVLGTFPAGWPVFLTLSSYRRSHVLEHHRFLGRTAHDPDLQYMLAAGVYAPHTRQSYVRRYVLGPALGRFVPRHLLHVLTRRLFPVAGARTFLAWTEIILFWFFWAVVVALAVRLGALVELVLLWVVPYLTLYQVVSWFAELSEHFPMMAPSATGFPARNRHGRVLERFFLGVHGDHQHLTHHLCPAVPFWNLARANDLFREDPRYRAWDDRWGGLLTRARPEAETFLGYLWHGEYLRHPSAPVAPAHEPRAAAEGQRVPS